MDPIADMLIRIQNAARARGKSVVVPYSNIKFQIASLLMKKGFVGDVQRKTRKVVKQMRKNLEMNLAYADTTPVLHGVRRVSKVSRRLYVKKSEIFKVKSGYGIAIVSTSKGIMTDADARKTGVGGEIIAEVW